MLPTSIFLQQDSEGHWEHFLESINMLTGCLLGTKCHSVYHGVFSIRNELLTSRPLRYSWENRTHTKVLKSFSWQATKIELNHSLGKRGMSWKTGVAKGRAEMWTAGCKAHLSPGLCPAPSHFCYSLCIGLSLRLSSFRWWPPSLLATWSTSCDCIT